MKTRILILGVDYGGHFSLAQSLKEALLKEKSDVFNISIEIPDLPQIMLTIFRLLITDLQFIWGKAYYLTDNKYASRFLNWLYVVLFIDRVEVMIKKDRPQIVITDVSFHSTIIAKLQKKYGFKSVMLVADPFSIHQTFLTNKDFDLYLAPTEEAAREISKTGIAAKKIDAIGWPVRKQFLSQLPIPHKIFTIFIGGSISGGGNITQLISHIYRAFGDQKIQLLVVCGKNEYLKHRLQKINKPKNIYAQFFSYTENVAPLMQTGDIVVGKAGPNVLFESITLEKPFLATGCFPGQEDGNLEFINKTQIGWVETDPKRAAEKLLYLSNNRDDLKLASENIRKIKKDYAFDENMVYQAIVKLT